VYKNTRVRLDKINNSQKRRERLLTVVINSRVCNQ
jgi:hypothetical protein